ncbi:hypothetical protein Q7P36_010329 [Cladosporium allicinum]
MSTSFVAKFACEVYANATFAAAASIVVWLVSVLIYRLHFHPLAGFPGPKLAALTSAWEFYHRSCLVETIKECHRTFDSPVIRVGPNELHFGDAFHFHQIYKSQEKFTKEPTFYRRLGVPGSILSVTDTEAHRDLRNLLSPYFSTRALDAKLDKMLSKCDAACQNVSRSIEMSQLIDTQNLASRLTWDLVSLMVFGEDYGTLEAVDRKSDVLDELGQYLSSIAYLKHIPHLTDILLMVPPWRSTKMVMEAAHRYQDKGPTSQDEHKTIFDGLINKFVQESGDGTLHLDRLPVRLLSDQAFMLLLAGTETTATTMVFLLHLLSENHHEESRLLHDLKKLGDMRDPRYDFRAASNLPIVRNIVREALRLGSPTPLAFPRVTPPQGAHIGDYHVGVGSSILMLHDDPKIFANPELFIPDRWLGEEGARLLSDWVPFQEGSRRCIAINLATTELSLLMIKLVGRFRFETLAPGGKLRFRNMMARLFDEPPLMRAFERERAEF